MLSFARVATARLCAVVAIATVVVGGSSAVAAAVSLPDGRAYELVSPPDKNGGDVMSEPTRTRASADGNAVSFLSLAGFGDIAGSGIAPEYLSRRDGAPGTNGWATHSIVPKVDPLSVNGAALNMDTLYTGEFSSDLSKGVLRTFTNLAGDPFVKNATNLYLRNDLLEPGAGTFQLLSACPVCVAPLTQNATSPNSIAGASADFGHIIFESKYNLLAGATGAQPKLYEWDHGTLRLAGILPASEGGGIAPTSIAGVGALNTRYTLHTISDDGSRIFFTVESSPGSTVGNLYMRESHTSTVRINASERTDCSGDPTCGGDGVPDPAPEPGGPFTARFETASADGSKVFFTTAEQLTDDDTNGAVDLYMYNTDLPAGDPHNLTLVSRSFDGLGARVERVAGASADGSYVYFFADRQIVAGGPAFSPHVGVFVWHDGTIRFIGFVPEDPDDPAGDALGTTFATAPINSRVAPNGKAFLFRAHNGSGLTGYDHSTVGCGPNGFDPCTELYLYHYDSDTLVCASCNPSGDPATADASFNFGTGLGGARIAQHLTHPLSDDGTRVFFTTGEALVPADQDGKANDVYEYDATTGEVHLLSTGRDLNGSYFLDASTSGNDVFFTTRQQLVGWDTDNAYDLYDARVGGGFPDPPTVSTCAADACQGALAAPPLVATPKSTAFFSGDDNVHRPATPLKGPSHRKACAKGRVRRRVHGKLKCVKRKRTAKKTTHRIQGRAK